VQGQLFDPENPPHAFSKEESNARLEEIKVGMRNAQLERVRARNEARHGNLFHDRRED
jgi:hypothetical protein